MNFGRLAIIGAVIVVIVGAFLYFRPSAEPTADEEAAKAQLIPLNITTSTGTHAYRVELADDPATQQRGLMNRTSMAADRGMVFDFKTPKMQSFWMRNTYISLDMIFFKSDGVVHRIETDTVPLSDTGVSSGVPVRYVLELNAGQSRKIGLKPGDKISFEGLGKTPTDN